MPRHHASLQGQLIRSVLAAVTVIWLLAAGATWFDARHELDELLDAHLAQSASLLLMQKFGDFDHDDIAPLPAGAGRYPTAVLFQVFQSGELKLKSPDAPQQAIVARGAPVAAYTTLTLGGQAWRAYITRDRARTLEVIVAERIAARQEILWAVLRSSLWPLVLALPLLALATWWMVRRGTAPIRELSQAVVSRQPQALEPIVVPGLTRELHPLLASMNGLFGRIATLLDTERRFTADAAHELRTPIAAIRMQAQVAAAATAPEQRQHALKATVEGCDRATHLVEQLLTLARVEANGNTDQHPLDLRELVRQVVAQLAFKSAEKQQELGLEAEQECPVQGNDMLLMVLFRNLLDNAIRYSPAAARIAVRLQRDNGCFELSIDDSGPGIAPADLPRLGERFFRLPGSGASGSGLGWSIARRIAALYGFELAAQPSAQLGGLTVRVSGPLLKQGEPGT
jgi:two-component system, OmpR family, sensor histidine kinase QseC